MTDTITHKPIRVLSYRGGGGEFMVPLTELELVKNLLNANHISYWVDDEVLSIDGDPEIAFITLSVKNSSAEVQRILDSVP